MNTASDTVGSRMGVYTSGEPTAVQLLEFQPRLTWMKKSDRQNSRKTECKNVSAEPKYNYYCYYYNSFSTFKIITSLIFLIHLYFFTHKHKLHITLSNLHSLTDKLTHACFLFNLYALSHTYEVSHESKHIPGEVSSIECSQIICLSKLFKSYIHRKFTKWKTQ